MNLKNIISNFFNPPSQKTSEKKKKRISYRLKQNRQFITEVEQQDLKEAILEARE